MTGFRAKDFLRLGHTRLEPAESLEKKIRKKRVYDILPKVRSVRVKRSVSGALMFVLNVNLLLKVHTLAAGPVLYCMESRVIIGPGRHNLLLNAFSKLHYYCYYCSKESPFDDAGRIGRSAPQRNI